jgi:hypothetical protein
MAETVAPHVAAYRAWRKAADAFDPARTTSAEREERRQARIARLKAKYEARLATARAAGDCE